MTQQAKQALEDAKINKSLEELKPMIIKWAADKGFADGDPARQMLKLIEEAGELAGGIAKGKQEEVKDALGDVFVVLVILSHQLGYDLTEEVNTVYGIISKRKGEIKNGVFVKQNDLPQDV